MPLSCECNSESEPGVTVWYNPEDYSTLKTKKRQRCCSCKELIDVGAVVGISHRYKIAKGDYEEARFGEYGEVPRADKYLCEECTDLLFSLDELGFCVYAGENQKELLKEYVEINKNRNNQ